MKLYITEYRTKDSTVRQITQHHKPEFPDKKIGDKLLTNHISDHETFCIGCGKENKTYYTKEHEIVEIGQYVKEMIGHDGVNDCSTSHIGRMYGFKL